MTVVYGPANVEGPGGTGNPPFDVYTSSFNTGDVIAGSWTGVTRDPGGGPGWEINIRYLTNTGNNTSYAFNAAFPQGADSFSHTVAASDVITVEIQGGGGWIPTPPGIFFHLALFQLDATGGSTPWCQYGGQTKPGTSQTYVLTTAVIDVIVAGALAATGQLELIPYVETAMAALEGTIPFTVTCSKVPRSPAAPLDLTNPSSLSPNNLLDWFSVAAWNYFCQCTPGPTGSPAPVTPIPPPVIAPPGADNAPPTFVCDNTDLCSYLEQLNAQLAAVQRQLQVLTTNVFTIQRYGVPFAYVPGTAQTGLSGQGTFTISRAIAFQVVMTALPPLRMLPGDPVYLWDVGWMAISDPSGMMQEQRITRQSMLWIPRDAQLATSFSYYLNPGVVMSVEPFQAEP